VLDVIIAVEWDGCALGPGSGNGLRVDIFAGNVNVGPRLKEPGGK